MLWQYYGQKRPPFAEAPEEGQESVWDYPRPPVVEHAGRSVEVRLGTTVIASSRAALRVLETASAPTVYIPESDIRTEWLRPSSSGSFCEWKGRARYFDLVLSDARLDDIAWTYPDPPGRFASLRGHFSFYPGRIDCFIGQERVAAQPGGFYGGWVTSGLAGPIKGAPGSSGW